MSQLTALTTFSKQPPVDNKHWYTTYTPQVKPNKLESSKVPTYVWFNKEQLSKRLEWAGESILAATFLGVSVLSGSAFCLTTILIIEIASHAFKRKELCSYTQPLKKSFWGRFIVPVCCFATAASLIPGVPSIFSMKFLGIIAPNPLIQALREVSTPCIKRLAVFAHRSYFSQFLPA